MKILYIIFVVVLFSCVGKNSSQINVDSKNDLIQETSIDPTGTYKLASETVTKDGDTYGYSGKIQVKKIGDDKIAVTFYVNKGAPSYNMGGFVDTLSFVNNKAIYKGLENTTDCRIEFAFSESGIMVKTDEGNSCGFGHGVYANGFFKKKSSIEPILENPFSGQRIDTKNSIYNKVDNAETTVAKKMPDVFSTFFEKKLVGLELVNEGYNSIYRVSFSSACNCEMLSMLMKKDVMKIYLFPYCNSQPSKEDYNNWEYNISSIDYVDNKMSVKGVCENSDNEEVVFIFGILDDENVFSLETEGDLPNTMWLEKYITNKEELFDVYDCGDYDG